MTCLIELSWNAFDSLRVDTPDVPCFHSEHICSRCGSIKVFSGDLPVCIGCGRVDNEYISDEAEWRSGMDNDGNGGGDPSRVGQAANLDHFSAAWGQTTKMVVLNNASYADKRLARINLHSSMNHRDRALYHAYIELDNIGKCILNLPESVMYIVKTKYREFNKNVLTRGAVRSGIKANCIFQACREANIPRTTKQIADAFGIPQRDISRTFDLYQEQIPEVQVHVITSSNLIGGLFNKITCVPEEHKGRTRMKISKRCDVYTEYVELMGRTPRALACASIFIVLKEGGFNPDKHEICRICEVSVPTLSKIEAVIRLKDSRI